MKSYRRVGATPLDEWTTVLALTGTALEALAAEPSPRDGAVLHRRSVTSGPAVIPLVACID